jgi:hypothetical protein
MSVDHSEPEIPEKPPLIKPEIEEPTEPEPEIEEVPVKTEDRPA